MASLSGLGVIGSPDLYSSSVTPGENLVVGQIAWDGKTGKAFRYTLAGETLVKGNLLQASVRTAQHENLAVGTAGAVGDRFVQVTNGTSTVSKAILAGGSLSIYTAGTVAICDEYTILDVTGTLTTGGALKVWIDRPLRSVVSTSATVNIKPSPWSGVIQAPVTTQTEMAVGVAQYEIPSGYYGWVQTHGICSVLSSNDTFAVGSELGTPCITAAGAPAVFAAGTTHQRIGVARMAAATTKGIVVFLQID